jgi:hypothetical protein
MKPEADVISICGKYRIYCERYWRDGATKTAIMVNGALATTISFTQTIRNLSPHVNVVLFDLPFAGESRKHNTGSGILRNEDELFQLNLASPSWGGVSVPLSLVRRPATMEKAPFALFPLSSMLRC